MKQKSRAELLIIITAIIVLSGCATQAPVVQHYSPDWKGQTLYWRDANGAAQSLPMSQAPALICEPPDQEAAYIKYCRSKSQ
jgi:hypothetical protein